MRAGGSNAESQVLVGSHTAQHFSGNTVASKTASEAGVISPEIYLGQAVQANELQHVLSSLPLEVSVFNLSLQKSRPSGAAKQFNTVPSGSHAWDRLGKSHPSPVLVKWQNWFQTMPAT